MTENNLTNQDIDMLHQIYLLRCLTISQIYLNFYKTDYQGVEDFRNNKVAELVREGYVEEVFFTSDNSALFLTRSGIDIVRNAFKIPVNLISDDGKIKKGYYTASDLKMQPKNIPHQVYLNQFMIDFRKIYDAKQMTINWEYFDEKYVSQYSAIRPDGMIRVGNVDFFLEMDMNTESKTQLETKWKNYQSFLYSPEYRMNDRKVIVLFIIENTLQVDNRKKIVELTAHDMLLHKMDKNFEIIIGTKEELLNTLINHLIPDITKTNARKMKLSEVLQVRHKLNSSDSTALSHYLDNQDYGFFSRKVNPETNSIIVEGNKIQGYFIEYAYPNSLYIISKIAYLERNCSGFHAEYKWMPDYIIVCQNKEKLRQELKFLKLDRVEKVYLTTIEDLENLPFERAIEPLKTYSFF